MAKVTVDELAKRIDVLEQGGGEESDGGPTQREEDDALREFVRRIETVEADDHPGDLSLGVAAMALRLDCSEEEVWAGLSDLETAWDLLGHVLAEGLEYDPWLTAPEGRGGVPLTKREVGLEAQSHDPSEYDGVDLSSRPGAGRTNGKWYLRSARAS